MKELQQREKMADNEQQRETEKMEDREEEKAL